jgi:hypothetical protein
LVPSGVHESDVVFDHKQPGAAKHRECDRLYLLHAGDRHRGGIDATGTTMRDAIRLIAQRGLM